MKDLKDLQRLLGITKNHFTKLTFEATVDTGFEQIAYEECTEKLGNNVVAAKTRGRIFINSNHNNYEKLDLLRGVDHINVLAGYVELDFTKDKSKDLDMIKSCIGAFDWEKALQIWSESIQFDGIIFPSVYEHNQAALKENSLNRGGEKFKEHVLINDVDETNAEFTKEVRFKGTTLEQALDSVVGVDSDEESIDNVDIRVPKFRVTCHRVGTDHSFGSMDAAWVFGGELHDKFHWLIDLEGHDLEVILYIQEQSVYVGLSLNRVSKHHRNITHFGPTTLRATVCYNMLRLCDPKPGDIVVDPLCGGGSIPIEAALEYPSCFTIGADVNKKAIDRFKNNFIDIQKYQAMKLDGIGWDVTELPLKTGSVDIFVTDLPFGKRSGSKLNNKTLYRDGLRELARAARLKTGRGVFLTYDKNSFNMAYTITRSFWRQIRFLSINIGGLDAGCFVLQRTDEEFVLKLSKSERKKVARLEWQKKRAQSNVRIVLKNIL